MSALQYKEFSPERTQNRSAPPVKWLAVAIAIIAMLAFCPIPTNDFISLDDGTLVAKNPDFNPPVPSHWAHYWTGPNQEAYQPMELYMPLTYTLWGGTAFLAQSTEAADHTTLNPAVFHDLSLFLHAINAILVYFILRKLVAGEWPAFLGAILFAVHPLQTESVAWVAETSVLLSTLFSLAAILAFMCFMDLRALNYRITGVSPVRFLRGEHGRDARDTVIQDTQLRTGEQIGAVGPVASRGWTHYFVATICLLLALLSKAPAVVVPAIVLVIEVLLRRRNWRTVVLPLIPWGLVCLPIALLTHHWQISHFTVPWAQRPAVAADALAFYLFKLIWPAELLPNYGRTPAWLMAHHLAAASSWIAPAALLILSAALWRKARWIAVATLLFIIALLPFLGLNVFVYQRFSTTADRYMYLAMLGPALALAFAIGLRPRPASYAIVGILLAILTGLSIRQSKFWSDSLTLFTRVIDARPDSQKGQEQVAVAYDTLARTQVAGRDSRAAAASTEQAHRHFLIAATLPDDDGISFYNAGNCSFRLREFSRAIAELKSALADPKFPLRAAAYNQLGVCYQQGQKDSPLAAQAYRDALDASNSEEFSMEHKAALDHLHRMELNKSFGGG